MRVGRCTSDVRPGLDPADASNVYLLTRTAAGARTQMRKMRLRTRRPAPRRPRPCGAPALAALPTPRRPRPRGAPAPHLAARQAYRRRVYVAVSVVCPSRTGSNARRMSLAEGTPLGISGAERA